MIRCTIKILLILFAFTQVNGQALEAYMREAAENNPGIQAKYKAFEASMERVSGVKTLDDPTLSFGYFISPVETRVGPQRARLSLSQRFPWFGGLKAREELAALQAEANYQVFIHERNKLYLQVAMSYFTLFESQQLLALERENAAILTSYKSIATGKFENGEGSLVDALRADLMLKESLTRVEILEKEQNPLKLSFNSILNRDENEEVIIDSVGLTALMVNQDSLFANHPELSELDLKIRASQQSSVVAHKQGLPSIGVGLDYVIVNPLDNPMVPEDNGKNAFMPMVSVGLPVFRGRVKAAKRESELWEESYTLLREERKNELNADYAQVQFALTRQMELLKLYEEQIAETQQVLNLLLSSYSTSGRDFEELLRVQQQLLQYKKSKVSAIADHETAVARMNFLMAKTY